MTKCNLVMELFCCIVEQIAGLLELEYKVVVFMFIFVFFLFFLSSLALRTSNCFLVLGFCVLSSAEARVTNSNNQPILR